jgi:NodT family efflux transporter outer membrane factor (OMF) lipoprotein
MMMRNKIITLISLAVLLNGCGIYTSYRRPEIQTEGLYGKTEAVADTLSAGRICWQDFFTDTFLQTLIEKGLNHNTDLQIARLRVTEAEASLQAAKLAFFPSLFFTPGGALSSFDRQPAVETWQVTPVASWEPDLFGKTRNAKQRSLAALEQSEAERQGVRTRLIASIANLYYTLLMLDAQLAISEETAGKWEENVRTTRAMKSAGMMTEASVSQMEANRHAIDAAVLSLRRQLNEVENALSVLLGDMPQQPVARGRLDSRSLPREVSAGIPAALLSNRPDVKSAEQLLAQMFYATNEARAAFYPSITLNGIAGWTNEAGALIVNPGKFLWSVAGSLTQPVFNRGINRAMLKIAEARQEEALLYFRQSLLNAGMEVNNALTRYQTARQRIEIDQKQIRSLETAVKSTQLLMKHGSSTYLEVLTAQETLLQAQLTHTADCFDEIQGIISLYHALGGGRDNTGK